MKPATSKPGNSEVYIVCQGYLGMKENILELLILHVGMYVCECRTIYI